jgi:peroxiredoxin
MDAHDANEAVPGKIQSVALALVGIGLFILGIVVLVYILPQMTGSAQTGYTSAAAAVVDYAAPDVQLEDFQGNPVSLKGLQGKWVLVNHWATWCPPCKAEMPTLVKYYEAHKNQNFVLVGIESGESPQDVAEFVKQYELTYLVWPDPQQKGLDAFKQEYLPSSYLIDPQGRVRIYWGGPLSLDELEQRITPHLEE